MHSALRQTKVLFPHLNVPAVNTGIITKFTNLQRLCSFSPLHLLWQRAYEGFRGGEVSRCYSGLALHEVQKLAGTLALCQVCYHRLTNLVLLEVVVSSWRLPMLSDSLLPSLSWHPSDSAHSLSGYKHGLGLPPAPRPLPQHPSGSLKPFCSAGACQQDLFSQHSVSLTSFSLSRSFQNWRLPWCLSETCMPTDNREAVLPRCPPGRLWGRAFLAASTFPALWIPMGCKPYATWKFNLVLGGRMEPWRASEAPRAPTWSAVLQKWYLFHLGVKPEVTF